MNSKSVVGEALVGGKKEILSLLSIDSSIPMVLARDVRGSKIRGVARR